MRPKAYWPRRGARLEASLYEVQTFVKVRANFYRSMQPERGGGRAVVHCA